MQKGAFHCATPTRPSADEKAFSPERSFAPKKAVVADGTALVQSASPTTRYFPGLAQKLLPGGQAEITRPENLDC